MDLFTDHKRRPAIGVSFMRPILFLVPVFFLVLTGRAEARLGDSQETLDKKHGEGKTVPPEKGLQIRLYRNEGLSILVYFKNGRSAKEVYSVQATEEKGKAGEAFIKPEIFQALLKANSAGKHWLPLDEKGEVSQGEEPARLKGDLGDYSVLMREDQQALVQLFFKGDKITTIVVTEASLAGTN